MVGGGLESQWVANLFQWEYILLPASKQETNLPTGHLAGVLPQRLMVLLPWARLVAVAIKTGPQKVVSIQEPTQQHLPLQRCQSWMLRHCDKLLLKVSQLRNLLGSSFAHK